MAYKDKSLQEADRIDKEFLNKGVGKLTYIDENFGWYKEDTK